MARDWVDYFIDRLTGENHLSESENLALEKELQEVELTPEQEIRLEQSGFPEMLHMTCDAIRMTHRARP